MSWRSQQKKRALLGIEPFLERPLLEPPLRWERWRIILKLDPAKEAISIDTLRETHPDKVALPPKPIQKEDLENSTAQSKCDREIRNEQLKNT